ncbi:MAG TPA: hypothetical protein PK718_01375 [Candidatus Methanofastidiosa archaeon]|nr:hypothetical protein [Candidatus Methanofastidiosa archaeon]
MAPLDQLRDNTDVLILPEETDRGAKLNPNTVDICTRLISRGVSAKMLAGDTFEVSSERDGIKTLPTLYTLNHEKDDVITAVLGEWILKNTPEDFEIVFSFIVEEKGAFLKNSISGTLDEIAMILADEP